MFSNDILSLYDFCMTFVYFYTIYKRIILGQHEWDTFETLTILDKIYLPRGHPDVGFQMNLPRISEFHNCSNGIKSFSLDILTRSDTLKLFPFLLVLPDIFLHSY